jgi:hypothetical protein
MEAKKAAGNRDQSMPPSNLENDDVSGKASLFY